MCGKKYDIERSGYPYHLWLLSEQYPRVEENKWAPIIERGGRPVTAGGDKEDVEGGWLRRIVWENNQVNAQYPEPRFSESAY